jgi:hypothetical protein
MVSRKGRVGGSVFDVKDTFNITDYKQLEGTPYVDETGRMISPLSDKVEVTFYYDALESPIFFNGRVIVEMPNVSTFSEFDLKQEVIKELGNILTK